MGDTTTTTARGRSADAGGPGDDRTAAGAAPPAGSRGRRIAFRVLAGVLSAWVLLIGIFGLTEVVLMWLPAETVGAMMDEPGGPDVELHRTHFMAVGILAWATVLPTLAQLRRPERRVGSMLFLGVLAIASLVVFGLTGTLGEWVLEEWTWALPVLALALLHPRARDLVRWPGHDRRQLTLAGIAAVPWTWYAVTNVGHQVANDAGDEHAALEHWGIAALLAVIVVAGAVIGSSDHDGWRLPAWIAALASILFGAHSLAFSGGASGLAAPWAIAAVLWGAAAAVVIVLRVRGARVGTAHPTGGST